MNSAHSFTEGMDLPEGDPIHEAIHEAVETGYNIGYEAATKNLKDALNLIPVEMISKDHIFRLIDIVAKVSKSN